MIKNSLQTVASLIALVFLSQISFAQRNGTANKAQDLLPTNPKTIQALNEYAASMESQQGGDILGCTDLTACNYVESATLDDGSCCFENCYTLVAFNGGIPLAKGIIGGGELAWTITQGNQVVAQGPSSFEFLCLPDGCYELNLPFASGYEISLIPGNGLILAKGGGGFNSSIEVDFSSSDIGSVSLPFSVNGECPGGCTSAQACNFDPTALFDDGSCTFPGCCDPNACNFSLDAGCPSECFYPDACGVCGASEAGVQGFTQSLIDGNLTFSLLPNQGFIQVFPDYLYVEGSNLEDGGVLAKSAAGGGAPGEGPLTYVEIEIEQDGLYNFDWSYYTEDGPSFDIAFYAVDNGVDAPVFSALTSAVDGDQVQNGSAALLLFAGETLWLGIDATDNCCGAGYLTVYNFLSPSEECLAGCTNSNSCNFDVSAEFDDGSCIPSACDDIFAVNYDPQGNCGGGMCYYVNECGTLTDEDGNTYGFTGFYGSPNWSVSSDDANATVNIGPEQMVLVGADEGGDPITEATISAGATGQVSFDWSYTTTDDDASWDFAYYINGVPVQLSDDFGANVQEGSVSFAVSAGDLIGFQIDADDACCGFATLIINNFETSGGDCTPGESSCAGDLNADGLINSGDLLVFLTVYGTACL